MRNREEDKKVAAINAIKLNTKMYNLTALVVVFSLMLIIVNSVTSLVDYIPKYSIVALLFIVSILVAINYYLSRKVAMNAIQNMQKYEKKVDNLFTAMEKEIDSSHLTKEELEAMSPTDELTVLNNLHGFLPLAEQYLKSLKREHYITYLLYAGIDNMKHINATYGHQEGDSVIKTVADTLKDIYRESDLVARLGGDEFAILPVGFTESAVELLNNRLQEKLDKINSAAGQEYTISISYGLAEYNVESPCTVEELIAQAKHLMYEQKKGKKNI